MGFKLTDRVISLEMQWYAGRLGGDGVALRFFLLFGWGVCVFVGVACSGGRRGHFGRFVSGQGTENGRWDDKITEKEMSPDFIFWKGGGKALRKCF